MEEFRPFWVQPSIWFFIFGLEDSNGFLKIEEMSLRGVRRDNNDEAKDDVQSIPISSIRRIFKISPIPRKSIVFTLRSSLLDNQAARPFATSPVSTRARQSSSRFNGLTYVCRVLHKVRSTAALIDSVRIDSGIDCDFRLINQVTEVRIICKERNEKLM